MPCVTTWRGGSSRSPKKRALSARVRPVSVFSRVREPSDDDGLVEADVAVGADAEQLQVDAARRAMPASYASQAASRSAAWTSGPRTASGAKSTWPANSRSMTAR